MRPSSGGKVRGIHTKQRLSKIVSTMSVFGSFSHVEEGLGYGEGWWPFKIKHTGAHGGLNPAVLGTLPR